MRILTVINLILAFIAILLAALAFYAYVYHEDYEPFEDQDPAANAAYIDAQYARFRDRYNAFLPLWQQALITSFGETATRDQLNAHAKTIDVSFPPLTDPLPAIRSPTFEPVSQVSFLNALKWMNTHMKDAHAALQNALKGPEGFEDICQQIIQCQPKIGELLRYFHEYEKNTELDHAWEETQQLAAESKRIQKQAESGELVSQYNGPPSTVSFEKPAGARKGAEWAAYQRSHPKEAAESEKTLGPWAAVADWAHQMNARF